MPDNFEQFQGTSQYLVSPELRDAVNVAVTLGRPLLVRGEPGTGKTLLAKAIAEALGLELLTWHVKSTSKAQDGLYFYDTVQRLNDARFGDGDVRDLGRYIKLGALGEAFSRSHKTVVLIDEIDKADLEFPNDLLHELDAMSFRIVETRQTIVATQRPIVVITSNAEKELPDAFLRRCVFHYIAFPEPEFMRQIIRVHHPKLDEALLSQCVVRFYWLRDQPELRKRPSTSELIDWIGVLLASGIDPEKLLKEIPFLGVLLKREEDISALQRTLAQRRKTAS